MCEMPFELRTTCAASSTGKGSQKSLVIVEDLLQKVVRQVEPKATLKYNKHYIGIGV